MTADLAQRTRGFDLRHLALPVVSRRDHGIGRAEAEVEVVVLRFTAEDGRVPVPRGPGLGIAVDAGKLARFARGYEAT